MGRTFLGIDPGLSGGLVLLDERGQILEKHIIPVIENVTIKTSKVKKDPETGKGAKVESIRRTIDGVGLNRILIDLAPKTGIAIIEQVSARPGQGVVSQFNFGLALGFIQGVLVGNRIPFTTVTPSTWSKIIHAGIGGADPKGRSAVALGRLFPQVDLRPSTRSQKPHEGLMDALLIAEWARRKAAAGEL